MPTQEEQILQQLASIQEWINTVNANVKKIHEFADVSDLQGGNTVPISINNITYKVSLNALITYINQAIGIKENVYPDIAALLAAQVDQTTGKLQYVQDASADPNVTSGYAYYEKLATSTADLDDYRKLSQEEAAAVEAVSVFNAFTVGNIATSAPNITSVGNVIVEYENIGNKVTAILFDNLFSSYINGFASQGLGCVLKVFNKSQNKTLLARVTGFVFSDVSETNYRVEVNEVIGITDLNISDEIEVYIDVISYGVIESGNISAAFEFDYSKLYYGKKTMTADTTFTDKKLYDDGITRGMYLTGDFAPTFPAYWAADIDSDTFDGLKVCRLTWDVVNAESGTEEVSYFIKIIN